MTRPGDLFVPGEKGWVTCTACGHRCRIAPDHDGICKVRFNAAGVLMVPHGYVSGLQIDPIEKKPFFHVLPGAGALSFGMLGCDYHCAYCQNWFTSQTLRDPDAGAPHKSVTPDEIVALALEHRIPVITSTYNEPLITSEWAVRIFRLARQHGIRCSYVSNGNATPEVLQYLAPYLNFCKVDLKSFRQKNYQQLGGKLDTVLETIRRLKQMNVWVEVVTLVVPGFNDSDEELKDIAGFLCSVSPDIPWHVTAFHEDYKMTDPPSTTAAGLVRAATDRPGGGPPFRLCREPSGQNRTFGRHQVSGLQCDAYRTHRFPCPDESPEQRHLSRLRAADPGCLAVGLTRTSSHVRCRS